MKFMNQRPSILNRMIDELGDSRNERHVFVAQRTFQRVQFHLGEDEILTDLIVQIPRDFLSFVLSNPPKLGSEGFGNLIKFWKSALIKGRIAHFSMLLWQIFFQDFASQNIFSLAPRNRRRRNTRHSKRSLRKKLRKGWTVVPNITQFKCHESPRLSNFSYSCKQELTLPGLSTFFSHQTEIPSEV